MRRAGVRCKRCGIYKAPLPGVCVGSGACCALSVEKVPRETEADCCSVLRIMWREECHPVPAASSRVAVHDEEACALQM